VLRRLLLPLVPSENPCVQQTEGRVGQAVRGDMESPMLVWGGA
jgi:hypothetical protein